jgi:chromosome segregation ATPase
VCPGDLAPDFEKGYDIGRELYVRGRRVSDTEEAISSRQREIRRLEDSLTREAAVLVASDSSGEERAQSVIDAKQAAERIGRYKAEISSLARDLEQYRREYEEYRRTVPATY